MPNPILQALSSSVGNRTTSNQSQAGPLGNIMTMYNQVRNSPNPEQALQSMAMQNPQIQQAMQYAQQNGGDAKTAFYNLAAQRGVNAELILGLLR